MASVTLTLSSKTNKDTGKAEVLLRYRNTRAVALRGHSRTFILPKFFVDGKIVIKARVITMRQRMMPLFKAAAIVAIFLTLGNAAQVPFNDKTEKVSNISGYEQIPQGNSVAMGDSAAIDTLQQSNAQPINQPQTTILK